MDEFQEELQEEVSRRLYALRISKGLSQSQVAEGIGITQSAYQNYERGRREANYKMLVLLADFFDTSVDYLLGRRGHRESTFEDALLSMNMLTTGEKALLLTFVSLPPALRAELELEAVQIKRLFDEKTVSLLDEQEEIRDIDKLRNKYIKRRGDELVSVPSDVTSLRRATKRLKNIADRRKNDEKS